MHGMMTLAGRRAPLAVATLTLLAGGCARRESSLSPAALDRAATSYAKLALSLAHRDSDYVDAFYGPPEWKAEAERDSLPLARIVAQADSLVALLGAPPPAGADELSRLRQSFVRGQLRALAFRARLLSGEKHTFDEESRAMYQAVAPQRSDSSFDPALARLDSLLPGPGALVDRLDRFRSQFIVPEPRVERVIQAAIEEARRRTRLHIALPDSESFRLELVRHQPWGGYNWYQGGYRSVIQVNLDQPVYLEQVINLAAHEGYPGHHVANVLFEQRLVRGHGWREFTVGPLFGPRGLIDEGSANVAPDVAFPGRERDAFEKRVLFPLAGIDTALYARYRAVRSALDSLSGAGIENARRYLDGRQPHAASVDWAMRYGLQNRSRAEQGLRFDDRYRSYVVNYGLGKALVLEWLGRNGGGESNPERRWELFEALLSSPRLPADLH
jgi:hypothetical protein